MVKNYHDGYFMLDVAALTQFLAPALPILLKVTDQATDDLILIISALTIKIKTQQRTFIWLGHQPSG
jgi:hypothetical protein